MQLARKRRSLFFGQTASVSLTELLSWRRSSACRFSRQSRGARSAFTTTSRLEMEGGFATRAKKKLRLCRRGVIAFRTFRKSAIQLRVRRIQARLNSARRKTNDNLRITLLSSTGLLSSPP
jgi:hypothetical protein